jgi:deoxyhypusine monooxygenase
MQHPHSVPSLIQVLSNIKEEAMVRHEAAEALGSIATPECLPILAQFSKESSFEAHSSFDNEKDIKATGRGGEEHKVVQESCIVGLDMYNFEASGEFQYAEPLLTSPPSPQR